MRGLFQQLLSRVRRILMNLESQLKQSLRVEISLRIQGKASHILPRDEKISSNKSSLTNFTFTDVRPIL